MCEFDSDSTLDYCPRDGVRLVDPERALRARVGTSIDGRLTLLEYIGRGGMGAVYAARQHALDRLVAVKLVHPARSLDSAALKRFFAEARAVSRLSHPNVVSVFEFGQTDAGELYLVMELIAGDTLAARLKRVGRLPLPHALRLAEGLCAALQHAHDRGVIHRDVKPANLLLVPGLVPEQDYVKVVDFGLAKLAEGDQSQSSGTGGVGTPAYMSPEQAVGAPVDARSDVYSAAVVIYEVLTGVRPFDGATAQDLVNAHAFAQPPLLRLPGRAPHLPVAVEDVILGALAKSPAARPGSPREFLKELCAAASKSSRPSAVAIETTGAPPLAIARRAAEPVPAVAIASEPSPASGRRRTAVALVCAVGTALLALGLGWPTPVDHHDGPPTPVAPASPAAVALPAPAPTAADGPGTATLAPARGLGPAPTTPRRDSDSTERPRARRAPDDPVLAAAEVPAAAVEVLMSPSARPAARPSRPASPKRIRPERIVE